VRGSGIYSTRMPQHNRTGRGGAMHRGKSPPTPGKSLRAPQRSATTEMVCGLSSNIIQPEQVLPQIGPVYCQIEPL